MYISLAVLTFIGIMSSLGESKQASYGLASMSHVNICNGDTSMISYMFSLS